MNWTPKTYGMASKESGSYSAQFLSMEQTKKQVYKIEILSILHLKQCNVHVCQQFSTRKHKMISHYIFIVAYNTMANTLNSLIIVSCFLFPMAPDFWDTIYMNESMNVTYIMK